MILYTFSSIQILFGGKRADFPSRTPSVPMVGARTQRTNTTAPGIFLVSLGILISACLTPRDPGILLASRRRISQGNDGDWNEARRQERMKIGLTREWERGRGAGYVLVPCFCLCFSFLVKRQAHGLSVFRVSSATEQVPVPVPEK